MSAGLVYSATGEQQTGARIHSHQYCGQATGLLTESAGDKLMESCSALSVQETCVCVP